ncbi:MAG TPA: hypothetical protein VFE51_10315 [Verrucomicrobiae bacterium]|nr:hypothetical protein [Verrucomicrobiae bacterium]
MKISAPIFLLVIVLGGCVSGPSWTHRTFAFSVPADPPAAEARTNIVALNRVTISPLFQSRSFIYRTADNSYERDPYAGFLIPPERSLAEAIRGLMREAGAFGHVVDLGSGLRPNLIAEVSINELCGDFRNAAKPLGSMQIHFVCYELSDGFPGRVVVDRFCAHETALTAKTPSALMAAWDADLRDIMNEVVAEYKKANSNSL